MVCVSVVFFVVFVFGVFFIVDSTSLGLAMASDVGASRGRFVSLLLRRLARSGLQLRLRGRRVAEAAGVVGGDDAADVPPDRLVARVRESVRHVELVLADLDREGLRS